MTGHSDALEKLALNLVKLIDYDYGKEVELDDEEGILPKIMMMIQDWAMSDE